MSIHYFSSPGTMSTGKLAYYDMRSSQESVIRLIFEVCSCPADSDLCMFVPRGTRRCQIAPGCDLPPGSVYLGIFRGYALLCLTIDDAA